jgi:hypothetical protein
MNANAGAGCVHCSAVLLCGRRATIGADDGSRTRMTEGRGILSPLRLPVSPRPQRLDIPQKRGSARPYECLPPPV